MIKYKVKKAVFVRIGRNKNDKEHIGYYKIGKIYIGIKLDKPEIVTYYFSDFQSTNIFTYKVYLDYPFNSYMFTDEDMIEYFQNLNDYREEQINKIL